MGLIGAGGSILSSGLMIYIFGLNPIISASYTLLNVGVISFIGSVQYYKKNLVNIPVGIFFALPAIATVLCMRSFIMPAIPDVLFEFQGLIMSKELSIMLAFASLMIVIAGTMISESKPAIKQKATTVNKPVVALIGLAVGILTGLVGVGGGFVIVPALFFFTGLDMKSAVGTSLFIITLNTAVGFISDFSSGTIYNWMFLLKFILVTVTGMLISGLMISKIKTEKVKKLFAVIILLVGCWIIIKELVLERTLADKTVIDVKTDALILPAFPLLFEQ